LAPAELIDGQAIASQWECPKTAPIVIDFLQNSTNDERAQPGILFANLFKY
jgi:hypothetical protein